MRSFITIVALHVLVAAAATAAMAAQPAVATAAPAVAVPCHGDSQADCVKKTIVKHLGDGPGEAIVVIKTKGDDDAGCEEHVVVDLRSDVRRAHGELSHAVVPALVSLGGAASGSAQPHMVRVEFGDEHSGALPSVYIGVRALDIPAALAAHVGDEGVMIANVVEGSPADEAGLRQYDIIRMFNGQAIDSLKELTEAIAEAGEHEVSLTVVRNGQTHKGEITPTDRKRDEIVWKFEEESDDLIDDSLGFRGLVLDQDAMGQWSLNELGELEGLPEMLKDLNVELKVLGPKLFMHRLGNKELQWTDEDGQKFEFGLDLDLGDDDAQEVRVMTIKIVEDDGAALTLTDEDGDITVIRVDKDGVTSKHVYDADTLKAEDPEAYELWREHCRPNSAASWRFIHPQPDKRNDLRKTFDIQVRKHLAQEQARRQQHEAETARKQAAELHEQIIRQIESRRDEGEDEGGVHNKSVSITHDDDGRIELIIASDGKKVIYEFESLADFKAEEPELFQKYWRE